MLFICYKGHKPRRQLFWSVLNVDSLRSEELHFNIIFMSLNFAVNVDSLRYQVDHGATVFQCQPCFTVVCSVMIVVAGHGVYCTLDHGT